MFVFRLCCIAAVTAVCTVILKSHKSELVPLCLTAGGIILFLYAFDYLSASIEFLKSFSETTGIDNELIRVVFKILGIGFLIELTASSVKELGFEGIADKLILCGKLVIFVAAIPVLSGTYRIILNLINLA